MKVRHKRGHEVYEVVDQSPRYYVGQNYSLSGSATFALPKSDYEPLPTETWRDVTEEIGESEHYTLWHGGHLVLNVEKGYRLRKVRLCWRESLDAHDRGDYQDAFIVEKRNA
jgi:hypothetical protein